MKIDVIRESFGPRVFSLVEARVALGPTAKMTLSRLVLGGRLERVGRGRYRLADPSRRTRIDEARFGMLRDEVLRAPFTIALDGPDAVSAWTGGRYNVSPSAPGENVIWLAVARADREPLTAWLGERGFGVGDREEWPAGRGPKVILRSVPQLAPVSLEGCPVITKAAVLRIIRNEPAAYDGAEEWILET